MKDKNIQRLYELIPAQETMVYMLKYSLHKQVINVPISFSVERKIDFDLMQKALTVEIERNDCLRMRFVKKGGQIFQYFLDSVPTPKIEFVGRFATRDEQFAFFCADAAKPVRFLKGEIYRMYFFIDYKGKYGIYINCCHLIMDAIAAKTFFKDIFAVYDSLETGCEMPAPLYSFEGYLPKEYAYLKSERYERDKKFFVDFHTELGEPFYAGVHGPAMLERQRRFKPGLRVPVAFDPFNDKVNAVSLNASKADTIRIMGYCATNGVAPEILFETGYKIHCSRINYRESNTMMMVLCGRRLTREAQFMGGCLTQPLQMRTDTPDNMTFSEVVQNAIKVRTQLYKHSNFPYKDALKVVRDLYHFGEAQGDALMMLTWLPLDKMNEIFGTKVDLQWYPLDRYIMPLYTFTYINVELNQLQFEYRYRTNNITLEHIEDLHDNCIKAILMGIDNPNMTLRELYDALDKENRK